MKKLFAFIAALALTCVGLIGAASAQATACVPSEEVAAYDDPPTITPQPDTIEVVKAAHWQRYSWTGGPVEEYTYPAFPSDDWQPNVEGDPHGIGQPGAYFRSHGNSGNGDWFYLQWVEEITKVVHHDPIITPGAHHDAVPAVICEPCPTDTATPTPTPTPSDTPTETPTPTPTPTETPTPTPTPTETTPPPPDDDNPTPTPTPSDTPTSTPTPTQTTPPPGDTPTSTPTPTPTETTPVVVTPTPTSTTPVPVKAEIITAAPDESLAATGSWLERIAPWALGFITLGIAAVVLRYAGRKYSTKP